MFVLRRERLHPDIPGRTSMRSEITSIQPLKIEDRSYGRVFRYLEKQGSLRVRFLEYSLLKQLYFILKGREQSPLARIPLNIGNLTALLCSRGRTLIVGAAPDNPVTGLLNRLKRKHRCIYFTSWPYWEGEPFERAVGSRHAMRSWERFLDGMVSVGVTERVCESLKRRGAVPHFIPHSVDADLFKPLSGTKDAGPTKVLFVGNLLRLKGVPLLLGLVGRCRCKETEFWFVGRGPYAADIIRLQQQGYPVRYWGHVSDQKLLVSIYRQADMLVLPSIRVGDEEEKFGIVLLEAMACGIPVIASDCVGPKTVVEHERTGILIPQNDEAALKAAISLLAGSPDLRERLGRAGRKRVEELYDLKRVAERWLSVIEAVHGGGRKSEVST